MFIGLLRKVQSKHINREKELKKKNYTENDNKLTHEHFAEKPF